MLSTLSYPHHSPPLTLQYITPHPMLRRLLKPLSSSFCTQPLLDPLQPIRTRLSQGSPLQDYQYSKLIQDLLKKNQSLSAYNILIHSYLNNTLLDKQIFSRVEKSLGELEGTYKDVLSKMYNKHFSAVAGVGAVKTERKPRGVNEIDQEIRQLEEQYKANLDKISINNRLIKEGEVLMSDMMSKIDFQRVSFKNVKINFDYDWISQVEDFERSSSMPKLSQEEELLDDRDVLVSEEDEFESDVEEDFTIEDVIRSIKSIDIGEVEFITGNKDK